MVVAFACGVVSSRVVLSASGIEGYSLYTLVATLPALVPFLDFGAGAAIVNTVARSKDVRTDPLLLAQLLTTLRILTASATVVILVAATFSFLDLWKYVLGNAAHGHQSLNGLMLLCVASFAASVPLSIWSRLLLGLQRNHVVVIVQGLQAPMTLVLVWLVTASQTTSGIIILAPYAAILLVAIAGTWRADKSTYGILRAAYLAAFRKWKTQGARVMHMGWPMMAQILATPISTQLTRLIVAQYVGAYALAQYGLIAQVVTPAMGLISTVGVTLWPYFIQAKSRGQRHFGPFQLALLFVGVAFVGSGAVITIGGPLFDFISEGAIDVPVWMLAAFCLPLLSQAFLYPLGMYLMDPAGIRFQVVPALAMTIGTVTFVIVLAPAIGISAAPLGLFIATLAAQIVPFSLRILRSEQK